MFVLNGGREEEKLYSDSVFSAYTYTGNGSTQTITNGIDLAGHGGLSWIKDRSVANNHILVHSAVGMGAYRHTGGALADSDTSANPFAFLSNGFTIPGPFANTSSMVSWTFRNAPKFYTHSVVVKSSGSNATVDMSTLGVVGMVRVKRTDSTGSWYIWHRSLTAGKLLIGETTDAETTLGHITVSGTTVTLVNGVIADGTYLVEAYAHDTSADGIIQCGSFTKDGSNLATVNLGWEPQSIEIKIINSTANWWHWDSSRGMPVTGDSPLLSANTSGAETIVNPPFLVPTATGFNGTTAFGSAGQIYIFRAIRRPNKPPTTGTQVYNAIARTGTGAAATVTGVGFAPDLVMAKDRNAANPECQFDRLRGAAALLSTPNTDSEVAGLSDSLTSFTMDGVVLGANALYTRINGNGNSYINHFFRRAPGVHDQICTTGTGANKTEAHNLTVAPELWLHKGRSGATEWVWGSTLLAATEKIVMPSPNGKVADATAWNSTYPTASVISFGTAAAVNTAAATYTTYLWASLPGVSKVFGYTGNGTTQTINCGFAAGARFVMIIRTTAATAQDIFIWDTVRGIVAANDPRLSLNTSAAEVTTDDSIDPDASGFIVSQLAATNINVNGASYLFLAYA